MIYQSTTPQPMTYHVATTATTRGGIIGKPEDALGYLRLSKIQLQPGDTLLICLDSRNVPIGHQFFAYHPIQTDGPPPQEIFRHAMDRHASRVLLLCSHPLIPHGPFMPTETMLNHAAKCSLAGKLLDVQVVDYLVMNASVIESLLMDFHDRLCRLALRYSQQHANPLFTPLCPN